MDVPGWLWVATLVGLGTILLFDLAIVGRRPHEPSLRESSILVLLYIGLAVAFGIAVGVASGPVYAGEYFAGWITEYSLSVDNLFVFVIIMSQFRVPRKYQQKALFIGIILALVLRGIFIAAGAAAIKQFSWVFYLFGAFLVYTAIKLALHSDSDEEEYQENVVIRWARRVLPLVPEYHGARLTIRLSSGRRMLTPMLVVLIAIGTTDLMFALDSIPAVFGLTSEPYLVFTVNVFALMGLRQLYFLLGGLLGRLVYLSIGLSAVLGFIGLKLVLEALHDNHVWFINGGEPVGWAPELPIQVSLGVVIGTLVVTTLASLARSRRTQRVAVLAGASTPAVPSKD
jgi:tellurite resistance protein TerC